MTATTPRVRNVSAWPPHPAQGRPAQERAALEREARDEAPWIVGVDEAGRGPLAGPVVAAAVVLGPGAPEGIGDSKAISPDRRAELDVAIRASCRWAVAVIDPGEIDRINIFQATMEAMTRCVARPVRRASATTAAREWTPASNREHVLVDGNHTPARHRSGWRWPARAIVGGDGIEPAIGAASIVAKEWRDRLMIHAARRHPAYGWERNKGYGTREHVAALNAHGPCEWHRVSFAPVAQARLL